MGAAMYKSRHYYLFRSEGTWVLSPQFAEFNPKRFRTREEAVAFYGRSLSSASTRLMVLSQAG